MARRKPDKKKIIFYVIAIIAVALAAICRMDYADINSNLTLDENSIAVHPGTGQNRYLLPSHHCISK